VQIFHHEAHGLCVTVELTQAPLASLDGTLTPYISFALADASRTLHLNGLPAIDAGAVLDAEASMADG